jgi:nitric oxide reductase subunit B
VSLKRSRENSSFSTFCSFVQYHRSCAKQWDHAPVPERVVSEAGEEVFTHEDILQGQVAFLTYGLMEYGSIYGHGAYLGPDFTADYLHRQALAMREQYGGGADADQRVKQELQANRYDPATGTLTWSDGQIKAFDILRRHYESEILNRAQSGGGIGPHAVASPDESRQITAFIAWTAWTASARRPGVPIPTRTTGRRSRWPATT